MSRRMLGRVLLEALIVMLLAAAFGWVLGLILLGDTVGWGR